MLNVVKRGKETEMGDDAPPHHFLFHAELVLLVQCFSVYFAHLLIGERAYSTGQVLQCVSPKSPGVAYPVVSKHLHYGIIIATICPHMNPAVFKFDPIFKLFHKWFQLAMQRLPVKRRPPLAPSLVIRGWIFGAPMDVAPQFGLLWTNSEAKSPFKARSTKMDAPKPVSFGTQHFNSAQDSCR